jgi:predicted nucleic acid-binding protein
MIAADTSTWIAFLEGGKGEDVQLLDQALEDRQVLMVPVVLSELLSDPKLPARVAETLSEVPLIEIEEGYWQRAGILRAKAIAKGRKARLGDALIADEKGNTLINTGLGGTAIFGRLLTRLASSLCWGLVPAYGIAANDPASGWNLPRSAHRIPLRGRQPGDGVSLCIAKRFFREAVCHLTFVQRADGMSVFLKSSPLKRRGSLVILASA